MVTDRGLPASDAAGILIVAAIAGVVGRIGAGWLLDRVQKPQIGILWYVTGTVGIGLSIYPGSPSILIVGSACLGLALGAETELGAYYTSRFYDRKHFGEVLGLLSCCRSEEHTSELQSLMRISYAVFCLKKKKQN